MPSTNGVYTRAGGTTAVAGQKITATMHESEWNDLLAVLNQTAYKDAANEFSANPQKVVSTDAGALTTSLQFILHRNSASPTTADGLGQYLVNGEDSAGNETSYAGLSGIIASTTDTAEEGVASIRAMVAGSFGSVWNFRAGVYAQGLSHMGSQTVNALEYYVSGTAISSIYRPRVVSAGDAGTKSSGTFTPDVNANGNFRYYTNGGAHTLAPPSGTPGDSCELLILITNNSSAGAITTSGFTKVTGSFTTTDGHKFLCEITVVASNSHLRITALQ